MYRWKSNKGLYIYWFSKGNYIENFKRRNANTYPYNIFVEWELNYHFNNYINTYVTEESFNINDYINNFIKEIPEKAAIYFDKTSKFPRTKLTVTNYKRCIKPEKADVIVLGEKVNFLTPNEPFYIFTDSVDIFGIRADQLEQFFKGDLKVLQQETYGTAFKGSLKLIYFGPIKFITDNNDIIKAFNTGIYSKPFIIDNDLDCIVNQFLPDPTLQELETIKDMLYSSDSSNIKLGAIMVAGYNVNKWPLTFMVLTNPNLAWTKSENGGTSTVIKQLRNTLGLSNDTYGSMWKLSRKASKYNGTYLEEDVKLAQELVQMLPQFKRFIEANKDKAFYLDDLPFIPDEYKQ